MSAINIGISGATLQVINQVDSSTRVNSALGSLTLSGLEATYQNFLPIASGGGTVLTLPASTIWFLWVKNLGGISGTPGGNITVQVQATGGVLNTSANSPILPPGGVYIYACTAETAGGLIAVTLVASVANTPVEVLLGA